MKRYTAASVLAMQFCCDIQDITETRYQAGRTTRPVYVVGNDYYCAAKRGENPARAIRNTSDWEWEEYSSSFADSIGWKIWIHRA